ncbi:malto-oligosyltrehalose synthase [Leclercia adecarboxylata]|uniref:malto-oligosyltrehalose synthase n=1 Tax=Leclercia adecarboxylata TaxID=83655 RepID=UPI002DB85B58|nr:malto-oligosyltrehalose synthase [Leclercia adecarboxylata]MEB5748333.1 malto-oligosyltrehalose synthase [Leclercia adecarboxylata]
MIPTATWRIQFRNGMTFDRAASLVPYLQQLGISHLYASPIFTAARDSTHGYDVTDANEIDPAIGGRAGFERLVSALKAAGLGLILDIVPNHMSTSLENAWWRDVIEHGEKSRYARHFDIDWSRRLTLPFLGDDFDVVLANGEISIQRDPNTGKPALAVYDNFYPLTPESWMGREEEVLNLGEPEAIARLHDQQPWRLSSWRDAPRDLSWRRFFEITGLVGVRVEDDAVFDDSHALILALVRSGAVDGLRIDHVDGLADPRAYLQRLRQEAGADCYITVEKILSKGENLPADWPISGTTGYEFIASLSEVLVDDDKIDSLRQAYDAVVGSPVDMHAELRAARLLMVDRNFAGEFSTLLTLAKKLAQVEGVAIDEELLRLALRELLVAFPVYRTYGTAQGMSGADIRLLQNVLTHVNADPDALTLLTRILTGEVSDEARDTASQFRTRFQQLTGPLMAKSVEDTLFFRQHMDLALNEVGAEPVPRAFSLTRFHTEMTARRERQPDALSGTSTHDTKRGEDARARLYTLTEAPQVWAECVARWQQLNQTHVRFLNDGTAPRAADTWMLYQALAGVWPPALDPQDSAGLNALEARFLAFVEKALREAKLRTDWVDSNEAYETVVLEYARHLLSPDNQDFLRDFSTSLRPFIRAGLVNSLSQTVIKLTAPGVPDVYQGSEGLNFSLVDPDNRREPDFAQLSQQLNSADVHTASREASWLDGQLKVYVTSTLLNLRQRKPALFRLGSYVALLTRGERADKAIAFVRVDDDDVLIVVAPRLAFASAAQTFPLTGAALWGDTEVVLPAELAGRRYQDCFSGEIVIPGESLKLHDAQDCWRVLLACG